MGVGLCVSGVVAFVCLLRVGWRGGWRHSCGDAPPTTPHSLLSSLSYDPQSRARGDSLASAPGREASSRSGSARRRGLAGERGGEREGARAEREGARAPGAAGEWVRAPHRSSRSRARLSLSRIISRSPGARAPTVPRRSTCASIAGEGSSRAVRERESARQKSGEAGEPPFNRGERERGEVGEGAAARSIGGPGARRVALHYQSAGARPHSGCRDPPRASKRCAGAPPARWRRGPPRARPSGGGEVVLLWFCVFASLRRPLCVSSRGSKSW